MFLSWESTYLVDFFFTIVSAFRIWEKIAKEDKVKNKIREMRMELDLGYGVLVSIYPHYITGRDAARCFHRGMAVLVN